MPLAAPDPYATEPPAPATIAFFCPSCSNRLTVPLALAGVSGPCPHCSTEIESPALPSVEPTPQPIETGPATPSDPISAPPPIVTPRPSSIQPRGGSRSPQINIRSVSTIDWASDEAREASRRYRGDLSTIERIDHRLESVTKSNRFESARAIGSVIAVAIMAGTIFFMAMTGWGNQKLPEVESAVTSAPAAEYAGAPSPPAQGAEIYPWREPLPEVKRDEDDPFYRE